MPLDLSPISSALVMAAASAITGLAGSGMAMMPRLYRWLGSHTHSARTALIREAVRNGALNGVMAYRAGGGTLDQAVSGAVAYAKQSVPETLKVVAVSDATLQQMASAAVADLVIGQGGGPRPAEGLGR